MSIRESFYLFVLAVSLAVPAADAQVTVPHTIGIEHNEALHLEGLAALALQVHFQALQECPLDTDIDVLSNSVGYKFPGNQDCKFSPLEAAEALFCSTSKQICVPYAQLPGLAKALHEPYQGKNVHDADLGMMVSFESNSIVLAIYKPVSYRYQREPHKHPEGWEETEFKFYGDVPEKTGLHFDLTRLRTKLGICEQESGQDCAREILCIDRDLDLALEVCTGKELDKPSRTQLDQIYKDLVSSLYVQANRGWE